MDDEKLKNCSCDHEETCDCGCEDEEDVMVDLEDENGKTVSCKVTDEFMFENKNFVLVENPEDNSVYMFKVVEKDGEQELIVPEDDEFEAASSYYENSLESEE